MGFRSITAFGVTGFFVLTACSGAGTNDQFDDEKAATTVAALDVGTSAPESADLDSVDPSKAASDLAAAKTESCRTRTVDPINPHVVHVVLAGCAGRFDRHVVSGDLTVTFSSNADGSLHSESVSSNLTIDGRPFTRTVSEDIAIAGNIRTVTRHAEKTGTKANGETFVHTGDEVVVTDKSTGCRTENGTGHSVIGGGRNIESTITNFQTCEAPSGEDYCPTGSIEHVNEAKGKTILKTFDGSATVNIDISKPKREVTTTWTLACTPRP